MQSLPQRSAAQSNGVPHWSTIASKNNFRSTKQGEQRWDLCRASIATGWNPWSSGGISASKRIEAGEVWRKAGRLPRGRRGTCASGRRSRPSETAPWRTFRRTTGWSTRDTPRAAPSTPPQPSRGRTASSTKTTCSGRTPCLLALPPLCVNPPFSFSPVSGSQGLTWA